MSRGAILSDAAAARLLVSRHFIARRRLR